MSKLDLNRFGVRALLALALPLSLLLAGCNGSDGSPGTAGPSGTPAGGNQFAVPVAGVGPSDSAENIFVRRVGHGPKVIVLVPGNNTSGASFEPLLQVFRAVDAYNDAYTVYAFDYRGSGRSSYNTKITGLKDFAADFERVMDKLELSEGFPASGVTLVGYSMGFAVALEMTIANPARYDRLVGLAPVGTRGVRVDFNAGSAGTDALGNSYAAGERVPVSDDMTGLAATELNQAVWQGANRNYLGVSTIWDMLVINDQLDYDIATFTVGDPTYKSHPDYQAVIEDVLSIEYMPESLYYSHTFNVSDSDVTGGGNNVTVVGDGRLNAAGLGGKSALLVKAKTDFATWRGDQVIYDNYVATSKFDLKEAGVTTTAVMIDAGQSYDHGFPLTHPMEVAKLLDAYIDGTLDEAAAETALGATVDFHPHAETTFETDTFTGF